MLLPSHGMIYKSSLAFKSDGFTILIFKGVVSLKIGLNFIYGRYWLTDTFVIFGALCLIPLVLIFIIAQRFAI